MRLVTGWLVAIAWALTARAVEAPAAPSQVLGGEKIIIDTDIGTDIDDAFAIALALQSPELHILGFATASGDTAARARILDQLLGATGHNALAVAAGAATTLPHFPAVGRQAHFGDKGPFAKPAHAAATEFILEQIHRYPGQITLVAIGPLTNLGALIDKDSRTFHQLKRIVIMGGSLGAADLGGWGVATDMPEYNIEGDIHAAQKVFQSGVPLFVMPLDSTQELKLDEVKRDQLLTRGTPLSNSLGVLYLMWGNPTPILYDAMPVAFLIRPELCPVVSMHLVVDDSGRTRQEAGAPNAQVCLHSDPDTFFHFYLSRFSDPS